MKILIDMNLSPRWADTFTSAGFEAAHWSSIGSPETPDQQIMEFAAQFDWVVFTHDLDFGAILAVTHGLKPSVVQIRSEAVSPEQVAHLVLSGITQMRSELEAGVLMTIDPRRTRIRLLPLIDRD